MDPGDSILDKIDFSKMTEDTKNLLIKMENYMQKIMQKELKAFDEYIEDKLTQYDDHLIDYDEVESLRKKFYERIHKRMLNILDDAFNNDNKEMQQYFIDRLSPNVITNNLYLYSTQFLRRLVGLLLDSPWRLQETQEFPISSYFFF